MNVDRYVGPAWEEKEGENEIEKTKAFYSLKVVGCIDVLASLKRGHCKDKGDIASERP